MTEPLPNYSVQELNAAVGKLLERGFPPRFLLNATVSRSQLKKGHLWLTLTDGKATISSVIWASQLQKINFSPKETEGVVIVGKLNFWETRANLIVQILDIRPSLSTVLQQFEVVRELLLKQGLLDETRRRALPLYPNCIALMTSSPSSALADMLRTAKERWPLTKIFVVPIPVQGSVAGQIQNALKKLQLLQKSLGIEAVVLARGGGSREDLMVFDDEALCRDLSAFPIPVITGLGHEDDLTVADLVADYRAATPTAAIVALLPSVQVAKENCLQRRRQLQDYAEWLLSQERNKLDSLRNEWISVGPSALLIKEKEKLRQKRQLLNAFSPERLLARGFSIVLNQQGKPVSSIKDVSKNELLSILVSDGQIGSRVDNIDPKLKSHEES